MSPHPASPKRNSVPAHSGAFFGIGRPGLTQATRTAFSDRHGGYERHG